MTENETTTLWLGAFRYHCGRMTYAVGEFTDLLIKEWPNLPGHCKSLIRRDLEEEFVRDDYARETGKYQGTLGHPCDRESWEKVRNLWQHG